MTGSHRVSLGWRFLSRPSFLTIWQSTSRLYCGVRLCWDLSGVFPQDQAWVRKTTGVSDTECHLYHTLSGAYTGPMLMLTLITRWE